ncbi:hypothetical protein [Apilactobacillus xinyiensis]|uniref:hypothetical protein n=1 Tax=Apilactobacillus xinyiensis TaxID=2841032 RepID=UPI00200D5C34|nr:hypothetical protein [Apilactobacillus xinyiensis]MCL0330572.1 hypothetical protein [Apilactobacillus xinyiensis]
MKIKNDYLTILKNADEKGLARVRDFFNNNENIKKPVTSAQSNGLSKNINASIISQKEAK